MLALEPSVAQGPQSYSRRLPALGRISKVYGSVLESTGNYLSVRVSS